MYLKHFLTIKNPDGLIDIEVAVINKPKKYKKYTYTLASEYAARRFHNFYRWGAWGKALAILNEFKIKNTEEN